MARPASGRPPDRKLAREILGRLPDGFKIAYSDRSKSSHPCVFDETGEVVRSNGIPIQIAASSRNRRTIANVLTRLRRAGVPIR